MAYPTAPTFDPGDQKYKDAKYFDKYKDLYKPAVQQSGFDPNAPTKYSDVEQSAISRLGSIIEHGGYSPEQKATMVGGAMAPIHEQAEIQRQESQADAYARGLGQSSVLSRGYGEIDKSVLSNLAQISGGIEQQGAEMVPAAIEAVQSGQIDFQKMTMENEQFNANLRQQHEQLAAQLSISEAELGVAIDRINSAQYMGAADRELAMTQLMNDFNMSAAELALAVQIAKDEVEASKREFWSDLISNILGSAATVAGAGLGA